MPDPINALAERIDTLPLAVKRGLVGLIQTFGEHLLDFNRTYLAAGDRPDGTPIDANGYSPAYAAYRAKYGKQTRVKDLNFTGDYYKGFRLPYLGNLRFTIENIDPKAAKLLDSYGELYGVREEDVKDFIVTYLVPDLRQLILTHVRT